MILGQPSGRVLLAIHAQGFHAASVGGDAFVWSRGEGPIARPDSRIGPVHPGDRGRKAKDDGSLGLPQGETAQARVLKRRNNSRWPVLRQVSGSHPGFKSELTACIMNPDLLYFRVPCDVQLPFACPP